DELRQGRPAVGRAPALFLPGLAVPPAYGSGQFPGGATIITPRNRIVLNLRLPRRLRDPFTALLLFGAAGIVAMILAFAITSLPRLGGPSMPPVSGSQVSSPAPAADSGSPSPAATEERGHGHGKKN